MNAAASLLGQVEGRQRTFSRDDHHAHLGADFFAKAKAGIYTDMTLITTDKAISAHKLVISACSDYLAPIINMSNCSNPVIVLKDASGVAMELLMEYMYLGQVSVDENDLIAFLELAKFLKIRGLTGEDSNPHLDLAPKIWENDVAATFMKFLLAKQIRDSVAAQFLSSLPPAILNSLASSVAQVPLLPDFDPRRLSAFTATSESADLPVSTERNSHELPDDCMSPRELGVVTEGEDSEEEETQDGSSEKTLLADFNAAQASKNHWGFDVNNADAVEREGFPKEPAVDYRLWMQPNWTMDRSLETAHLLRLRPVPQQVSTLSPSGKPMVSCDICGKKLSDTSSLYRHKKIHSGEKPFKCPCCEKRFTQRYNMKQHLKIHMTQ